MCFQSRYRLLLLILQCCSKAKDLEVEAKDFKIFSRPRPRTCKSRPRT